MPDASASGASTSKNDGSARNRHEHNQGNQDRKYTVEQKAAVLRIRRCQPTAFYEILELQKTCTDTEVKKAYRKLSLMTHPDKNGHENADEAFKMVARAFSVLGDKEKRDKFDRLGTDPDSRFASAQAQAAQNPFGGFANRRAGGGGWGEEEISPEEMFARFFGGGGFGGGGFGGPFAGFDGGPQFVFNFGGGPGVRVHQFGGARPRARPRNPGQEEPPASLWSTIIGLLPIIILVLWPVLSGIFSGISSSTPSVPSMAFDEPNPPLYTMERTMPNFKVRYYLNPADIHSYTPSKLSSLDKRAEVVLVQQLRIKCENEMAHKQQLRNAAQGWFFPDPAKMELANDYSMPACRRLNGLGL